MENTVVTENVTQTTETNAAPQETAGKTEPISYELKIPEGSEFPESKLDEIASFARERGLSKEVAQAVLEREAGALKAHKEAEAQRWTQVQQQWVEDLKSDKVYGGENFDKTVANAKRALARFAPESLMELLNRTGMGNHKDVIVTFARIGEAFAEDSLITRGASSQPAKAKTLEDIFYGGAKE
jgi:hypothetical protein